MEGGLTREETDENLVTISCELHNLDTNNIDGVQVTRFVRYCH
jgi:hypothetical protein